MTGGWPRLAIALWVPTLALTAWKIRSADPLDATSISADGRETIYVLPTERRAIVQTMNENLLALHDIFKALAADDMATVARIADSAARTQGPGGRLPALREVLPPPWRRSGKLVHKEFARVAKLADRGSTSSDVLARLSPLTSACVDCHNTYRLVTANSRRDP